MRKSVWIVLLTLVFTSSVFAKTRDGQTPSQETICDNETGAAYGLCNSYCEAMDCTDPEQRASNKACQSVRENFEKKTGRPIPCAVTCPCPGLLQLFEDITSGAVIVQKCVANDRLVYVRTINVEYAVVEDGPPATCSVDAEPPFVELTSTERLACRIALIRVAEAQGVVCTSGERNPAP